MLYTILGAGGAVGNALAAELEGKNVNLRLASRSGKYIKGAEIIKTDLARYHDTLEAVRNSDVVFLCAGLKYDHEVWKELWPVIMKNTIDACKFVNAKLVFVDNVYMYGFVDGKMTESTPYNPCSRKGEIRANISLKLEEEYKRENIQAVIARSADFYGPYSEKSSVPYILILDKLMKGKKAQMIANSDQPHSYTYTRDIAKALLILAETQTAFNQVWHLPTYNPGPDGKTFVKIAAEILGVKPRFSILQPWMIKAGGLFDKTVAELYEMIYQNKYPYHFDSTKFNSAFSYTPVGYEKGIKEHIEFIKTQR